MANARQLARWSGEVERCIAALGLIAETIHDDTSPAANRIPTEEQISRLRKATSTLLYVLDGGKIAPEPDDNDE